MVVVRAGQKPGEVDLMASAPGLKTATLHIKIERRNVATRK